MYISPYLILFFFFCSQFFLTLDKAPRSWSVLYDALVHIRFVSTLHEKFRERINNLNGHLVTDIGTDKLAQVRRHNRSFDMKRNERSRYKNSIRICYENDRTMEWAQISVQRPLPLSLLTRPHFVWL